MACSHDEKPENEGNTGGVVPNEFGKVGTHQPRDLAPLQPEEDNVASMVKSPPASTTGTL